MTKELYIRQAQESDIPVIQQLAEQTWEPTYRSILTQDQIAYMFQVIYTPEALKQQIHEGQTFLLLYVSDKPIGFASYSLKEQPSAIFKLNKIYLLPECQGLGYGKKLLIAVEKEIKLKGGTTLDLNVNRYNKAKDFYEQVGYNVHHEEDIAIGPYWMNDFIMRKYL